jgi:predicted nucleotidyltransferase
VPRALSREVFDPEAILRVLAEHRVEFVVVGGVAVQTHGYMRPTRDLDIIPRPDLANLSRLGEALAELGSQLHRTQRPVAITDPHILKRAALVPLITTYGRLDVINIKLTAGTPGRYSELRERAIDVDLGAIEVAVVGLDDLIRMKKAAGREQDRIDIGALTRLDEDLAREAGEST